MLVLGRIVSREGAVPGAGANRWPPLWAFVLAGALSLFAYALVLPQGVRGTGRIEWRLV